ncbi:hypothetical protein [Sphingobacterium paludis]|uniref:Uncharacterized protein n=1 Tax=Sphingobacterium paludis TaxID=1476465 RepID=A0A4R7CQF8_9SPHI|nr:hypothetical protein [Sphingobacterium paludis]TDS06597.1 hypothetical protein B0I21_11637 [Sphingobacterium paludis]
MERISGNNPLRQMVLRGKAREDFFAWHNANFQKDPVNVDIWLIGLQLELFSQFFGKPIRHANDFYDALAAYNNN